jgi:hypothetical protein
MTETPPTAEPLERLADGIAGRSQKRDHGIAWAKSDPTDLRSLLPGPPADPNNLRHCPVEPDTTLVWALWENMAGSVIHRLFTVKLPSGRELLVDDYDAPPYSHVIGVVDRDQDRAHLRAFQAAISGERTSEPLLPGFPSETRLAHVGVVLLDALAESLRRSPDAEEFLDEENTPSWANRAGEEAKQRLITALEEELEEPGDGERADTIEELLDEAERLPAWLWAIDADDAERIARLKQERPPIPLYTPQEVLEAFNPLQPSDDTLHKAAALLVVRDEL